MNPFDYLMVLVSIVVGLAMTTVLSNLAMLMHARERVVAYWPSIAWAVWLIFVEVQHWWGQYGARHTTDWTLGTFSLELLVPIELFLAASLVLPPRDEGGTIDLQAWYERNRAWFFGLLFTVPITSIVEEVLRSGHMNSMANFWFQIVFCAVALIAALVKSPRAQAWITAQAMGMTLLYVALLFVHLPG